MQVSQDPGANVGKTPEEPAGAAQDRVPVDVPDMDPADVDQFLSQFGSGHMVQIKRTAPLWCTGYITNVPLEHGLTLQEIRESYGGRRFRLRVMNERGTYVTQRTIEIADVPRENGVPIVNLDRGVEPEKPAAPPAPARSELGEFAGVMRDLMAQNQMMFARQSEIVEKLLLAPPEPEPAPLALPNPIDSVGQTIDLIASIRDLFPAAVASTAPEGEGTAQYLAIAEKILDKLANKRGAPAASSRAGRGRVVIRGGARSGAPAGLPTRSPAIPAAPPAAPLAPVAGVDDSGISGARAPVDESSTLAPIELGPEDVTEALLSMPLDTAAAAIRDVFAALPPAAQKRAVDILLGSADPTLDNSSTPGDPVEHGDGGTDPSEQDPPAVDP